MRAALGLGLLVSLAYTLVVPLYPAINNPNENVRLYMSAALAERGAYEITPYRHRWGWTNDAACVEVAADGSRSACVGPGRGAEREYFSVKAPGLSLAGALPYAALLEQPGRDALPRVAWLLRLCCVILPMLIFLAFYLRVLRREDAPAGMAEVVFLAVALGSPFLGYSLLFVSHAPSAAAAFGAFALLDARRRRGESLGVGRAAAAGLLAAGASFFEYPAFFASLALSLLAIRFYRRGELVAFLLGAAVPTALTMHFQARAFGSPFLPGHRFVESDFLRARHEQGFFGAEGFSLQTAGELLVHPRIGLFALTPLLALGVAGYALRLRDRAHRPTAATALFILAASFLSVCTLNNYDGGWSIGARYLVLLLPFLGHGSLIALRTVSARAPTLASTLMVAAGLAGVVASTAPSLIYPHVPPELDRPLRQLFLPLMSEGRWPPTLGAWFGASGAFAVLGILAAAAVATLAFALRSAPRPRRWIALTLGPLLACLWLTPQLLGGRADDDPEVLRAGELIRDTFTSSLPARARDAPSR
ncbi:MAG: hypothetical protein AAF447_23625 [Myxococcota bacterium]